MTGKKSFMIIDDCEPDRYLLKRSLKKIGFREKVFEEEDGKDALELFLSTAANKERYGDNFPPSLIFLDINMPLMGGFEFLENFEKLRKENGDYLPIVIMMFSSSEKEEDKKRALSYEFVKGYIMKGEFSPQSLEAKIKSVLDSDE